MAIVDVNVNIGHNRSTSGVTGGPARSEHPFD
jgi:hypothetical protein